LLPVASWRYRQNAYTRSQLLLTALLGGGISAGHSATSAIDGSHIVVGGIVVQIVFFGFVRFPVRHHCNLISALWDAPPRQRSSQNSTDISP